MGHEGGPETVENGADEDPPRGIGTDPEELEDAPRLGRGPGEPRKDLLHHCKQIGSLCKLDEAVGRRAAAERTNTTNNPTGGPKVPCIACQLEARLWGSNHWLTVLLFW